MFNDNQQNDSPSLSYTASIKYKFKLTQNFMFITANVGTLFEKLDELLDTWLKELFKHIDEHNPLFIAIHMQEVGGKNYKTSMEFIDQFFRKLLEYTHIRKYNRYFSAFDTDYTDDTKFTVEYTNNTNTSSSKISYLITIYLISKALGNIYLIHEQLKNVKLFNQKSKTLFELTNIMKFKKLYFFF